MGKVESDLVSEGNKLCPFLYNVYKVLVSTIKVLCLKKEGSPLTFFKTDVICIWVTAAVITDHLCM